MVEKTMSTDKKIVVNNELKEALVIAMVDWFLKSDVAEAPFIPLSDDYPTREDLKRLRHVLLRELTAATDEQFHDADEGIRRTIERVLVLF
jgi:hypothetical protein